MTPERIGQARRLASAAILAFGILAAAPIPYTAAPEQPTTYDCPKECVIEVGDGTATRDGFTRVHLRANSPVTLWVTPPKRVRSVQYGCVPVSWLRVNGFRPLDGATGFWTSKDGGVVVMGCDS